MFFNTRIAKQTSTTVQCIFTRQLFLLYNELLFSKNNELSSCEKIWMIPTHLLQSKISQSRKAMNCMISIIFCKQKTIDPIKAGIVSLGVLKR